MKKTLFLILIVLISCKKPIEHHIVVKDKFHTNLTLAFGSCNNQRIENNLLVTNVVKTMHFSAFRFSF